MKNVLLVRMDRIGDLVLSLPVDEVLGGEFQVTWAITRGLGFVPEHSQPPRKYQEFDRKLASFWNFLKFVRQNQFDIGVVFHAPWWVGFVLFLAGVPVRVGVLSQWHSFLFFNKKIRQKRSRSDRHELVYNFNLVEEGLGLLLNSKSVYLKIKAPDDPHILNKFKLNKKQYFVVHPGMGGSALNWPTENYKRLISELSLKNKVVITGTAADEKWLLPLKSSLENIENIIWLDQKITSIELLDILNNAISVVAPSTGVVHLAASLEVPTIGLYSPITVESPERWGPRGPRVRTLVPNVSGQTDFSDVMRFIEVNDVMNSMKDLKVL